MIKGGSIPIMKVPTIDFGFLSVSGLSNKDASEAFHEASKQYSPKAIETLASNFSFNQEGLARGSNPFVLTLLNQKILLPEGESLLSLSQFGQAFNSDKDFFKNTYQDTGIILRTNGDNIQRNDYVAKNLFKKLEKRGFRASPKSPVVISLTDLKLRQDSNSGYGLVWDLKEGANPVVAPEYGTGESVEKFTNYNERGIPVPSQKGEFTIWKREAGLSRVCSYDDGDADSGSDHLAYSYAVGRVTVGNGEVVPQNYIQVQEAVKQGEAKILQIKKDLESRVAKL